VFLFKKSNDDNNNAPTDPLTDNIWKRSVTDLYPDNNPSGELLIKPVQECDAEDRYIFTKTGFLQTNFGMVKCSLDENVGQQIYSLNACQTEMVIDGVTYNYLGIHTNQLKLGQPMPDYSSYDYVIILYDSVPR
jgi:hypothetical protein